MRLKPVVAAIATVLLLAGCEQKADTPASAEPESEAGAAADTTELTTQEEKLSYIFGQNIGGQFAADDVAIDVEVFSQGLSDALEGREAKLSEEEMIAALQTFQEEKMAEQQAEFDQQAEKNRAAGEAFLAENVEKEGVLTTESGLQYKVIEEGEGPSPTEESTVEVHYRGTLLDGSEFDSSYKRGQPASFGVTQVIPGWTEALTMMKEGAKWELYIPPSLASGPGGAGAMIGPEQTLIFEVELLDANVTEEEKAQGAAGAESAAESAPADAEAGAGTE